MSPHPKLTFLDIGGSVENWSERSLGLADDFGGTASVHDFESLPATAEILREPFRSSTAVEVLQVAASGESGEGDSVGVNSLFEVNGTQPVQCHVVTQLGLDDLASEGLLDLAHSIQIGIEGSDSNVLLGARQLFEIAWWCDTQ